MLRFSRLTLCVPHTKLSFHVAHPFCPCLTPHTPSRLFSELLNEMHTNLRQVRLLSGPVPEPSSQLLLETELPQEERSRREFSPPKMVKGEQSEREEKRGQGRSHLQNQQTREKFGKNLEVAQQHGMLCCGRPAGLPWWRRHPR